MISMNVTTGEVSQVDPAKFSTPLVISAGAVIMEIVWWDTARQIWIFLVRDLTGRAFPVGSIEVTVDDWVTW